MATESGGMEISALARDIAESLAKQEGDPMPSAMREEFVQRVLDKAEALGGYDFADYDDDDDDDSEDDEDEFDDDELDDSWPDDDDDDDGETE